MAHSTLSTAPEQQIPNYADRAAAVEQQARQLFAISLASGNLACIGAGVTETKGCGYESDGSDNIFFDIGIKNKAGRVFQRYESPHDISEPWLSQRLHQRFQMSTHAEPGGYIPPNRRVPKFPKAYDANAMARGDCTGRQVSAIDRFYSNGILYIGDKRDEVFGHVSPDHGLHVYTESFFRRNASEVAANLERIEGALAGLLLPEIVDVPMRAIEN